MDLLPAQIVGCLRRLAHARGRHDNAAAAARGTQRACSAARRRPGLSPGPHLPTHLRPVLRRGLQPTGAVRNRRSFGAGLAWTKRARAVGARPIPSSRLRARGGPAGGCPWEPQLWPELRGAPKRRRERSPKFPQRVRCSRGGLS